jgi:hypothetical protein
MVDCRGAPILDEVRVAASAADIGIYQPSAA